MSRQFTLAVHLPASVAYAPLFILRHTHFYLNLPYFIQSKFHQSYLITLFSNDDVLYVLPCLIYFLLAISRAGLSETAGMCKLFSFGKN